MAENEEFGRLEPVEYDEYPSSSTSSGSSPLAMKKVTSTSTYSGENLKKIGESCKNRLPPASAVQAMFLCTYLQDELQRQTECEELFRGHMFKLAQQESHAAAEHQRMKNLEKRMLALERQSVMDRVAASDVLIKIQEGKLKLTDRRVDTVDEKLLAVDAQLEKLKLQATSAEAAIEAHKAETEKKPAAPERDPLVAIIKQEVDVLFLDRDNILKMIEEAKTRLTKLEDNLRALTLQRSPQPLSPGPPPSQRLTIKTPNGTPLDLGVPKGMAHVGLKENATIRSFSPGHQWA